MVRATTRRVRGRRRRVRKAAKVSRGRSRHRTTTIDWSRAGRKY